MQNKSADGYWNIAAQVAKDVDAFRHKIYLNYWQDASSRGRSLNHGHCLRTFWIVYSALWRTGMCTICLYSHSELRFYTPCLFERNEIFCSLHSDISMFVRCWKKNSCIFFVRFRWIILLHNKHIIKYANFFSIINVFDNHGPLSSSWWIPCNLCKFSNRRIS